MKKIIIYTTKACPYCLKAKGLLDRKGVEYEELRVDENPELISEAVEKSGGRTTVPQIFFDDLHVGGCDELHALENEGELDSVLGI